MKKVITFIAGALLLVESGDGGLSPFGTALALGSGVVFAAYIILLDREAGNPLPLYRLMTVTSLTGAVLCAAAGLCMGCLTLVMTPQAWLFVALTALLVNARHLFYGVSYIERFARMKPLMRPYMIASLTDETYSVFCSLPAGESDGVMVRVALYDQLYWVAGSMLGSILAQQLPFDLTGVDYSMTALFIVICVERAMNRNDRLPLAVGGVCAVVCLLLLGPDAFLAPALAVTAILLTAMSNREAA